MPQQGKKINKRLMTNLVGKRTYNYIDNSAYEKEKRILNVHGKALLWYTITTM